ncbi:MAG: tetratricopeptide repeat protein [Myxococcota bacterium]
MSRPTNPTPRTFRRRRALWALALLAATLATWRPATDADFVLFDDDLLITRVAEIEAGLGWESVRWAFTSVDMANWMPLTRLSWMLDAELFGLDPRAFHATNVLLHALAAVLFFLALERLTGAAARSALVAALFALHPLGVEAVAWAAARRDVLAAVFAAASLLAYANRRPRWTAVWLAAGLLSKPMLVTWPLVLLLVDVWPLGCLRSRTDLWPRLREKTALFALAAAACATTLWSQAAAETIRPLEGLAFDVRVWNALASYGAYTLDAFWPSGLAVFYPHPGRAIAPASVAFGAALLLAGTGACFWQRRRRPAAWVGWLWYVGMLVPVIGLLQVGQAARADRYVYLPQLGLWLALVFPLFDAVRPWPAARRAAAAAAIVALLALAGATRAQIAHWRDSESLFLHALHVTEDNQVAHINLGLVLTQQGRLDEAASHLLAGLRAAPRSSVGTGLLGNVRAAQGRTAEAAHLYRRALELDPGSERWQRRLDQLREDSAR